ncbi:MAG: alpha/beta hydrolase [Gemmatimonadota bacterium]
MIRAREGVFEGAGGTVLRWRLWLPDHPRAAVLIVHGWGEHAGRYEMVAGTLTGRGLAVFAYDQRGHGRSEGARGHVDRFDDLVADLGRARDEAADRIGEPGITWVTLGHSLGGLVVLRALDTGLVGVAAAVISAPWLATAVPVSPLRRRLAEALDHVWPSVGLPTGTRPELLTRDPRMIREYREDPLNHSRMSPRLFFEVERTQAHVLQMPPLVRVPTLMLVPEADLLVDPATSIAYAEKRAGHGMELLRLPGLRHEPLNEVEREDVLRQVGSWMDGALDGSRG